MDYFGTPVNMRHQERIHVHSTVAVVVCVYHEHVPAVMDGCRYPHSAGKSGASGSRTPAVRHQRRIVRRLEARNGTGKLGWGDP